MIKNLLKIPCEIYSRVVGYYRPTNQWNPGKQEEFKERKEYKMNNDSEVEFQARMKSKT